MQDGQEKQTAVRQTNRLAWLKAEDSNGYTFLLLACKHGHAGIARELLEAGADVNQAGNVSRIHFCFHLRHLRCLCLPGFKWLHAV